MTTSADQSQYLNYSVFLFTINKEPVWRNMAFARARKVSSKCMIFIGLWQWLIVGQF